MKTTIIVLVAIVIALVILFYSIAGICICLKNWYSFKEMLSYGTFFEFCSTEQLNKFMKMMIFLTLFVVWGYPLYIIGSSLGYLGARIYLNS